MQVCLSVCLFVCPGEEQQLASVEERLRGAGVSVCLFVCPFDQSGNSIQLGGLTSVQVMTT